MKYYVDNTTIEEDNEILEKLNNFNDGTTMVTNELTQYLETNEMGEDNSYVKSLLEKNKEYFTKGNLLHVYTIFVISFHIC